MRNKEITDYSDEFSTLKELHEDSIGRKFTDEEFNEIFSTAEKSNPGLFKIADRFQSDMMGLLMTLDEATRTWENISFEKKAGKNPNDVSEMISDLEKVIDYYTNYKNPNWSIVATLAHIHEELGEQLYENYEKHLGYSKSVEEGIKRHSSASKELLREVFKRITQLQKKSYPADLGRWKKFFTELLEGFVGILPKLKVKATLQKDEKFYHHIMMAGYYEIQEKKLSDSIIDLKSSSDPDLRKAAESLEKQRQNMAAKSSFHQKKRKELHNAKIHGHWNDTIPTEEDARIYGEKFLKSKPELHSIGKKLSKQEQKKFNKTYKYASDNPNVIKSGTVVLESKGFERIIEEASDKTLRLKGDKNWIGINEVKFHE